MLHLVYTSTLRHSLYRKVLYAFTTIISGLVLLANGKYNNRDMNRSEYQ